MTKTYVSDSKMACAFPLAVRDDACAALSTFPSTRLIGKTFSAQIGGEFVTIPERIHNDPALIKIDSLTDLQKEFVHCLLTRHSSGFVREEHLTRIIGSKHIGVPPFVIQLTGEYVIEILRVIHQNLQSLDTSVYTAFLQGNRRFFSKIEQRVVSYWDCYYRCQTREEYVGFRLLDFFRSLVRNGAQAQQ